MSATSREGVVIVGSKPPLNYVTACLSLFNSGAAEVKIRARGQAICRAVDVVGLLRKGFVKDLKVRDISIGTQEFNLAGRSSRVSTMDIVLLKPDK
ncbi:MAG: archaea-specific DNA-binding protein [Thermoproteota archaeon]|nr:archaea-specific DNA-binding protein [Thermoproteota archaeon]